MRDQPQGNLTGLKALVGIMGVLIILGTAVVVGTAVHRLYANVAAPSMAAPALRGLAPGERIAGIAGAGGDLGVWVEGPAGGRILLIDPASGRVSEVLEERK